MMTWSRNRYTGRYESSARLWNNNTLEYEPYFSIKKEAKGWRMKNHKTGFTYLTSSLQTAKANCEAIYNRIPRQDEIEEGFAQGGGWSGGCCITADGNGFSWHKDENGHIVYD